MPQELPRSALLTRTDGLTNRVETGEEAELQARSDGRRRFQLDSLRGLAAVTVVLHHARSTVVDGHPRWYLVPFFCGESAVLFFFVLSGYVLSLPYWHDRALPYRRYVARRFFRIYVPFLGAFVVSLLCAAYFYNRSLPLTTWFLSTWHTPVTLAFVLKQLTMPQNPALNTAFWSLRYEMEMSILLPPICWILRKTNPLLTVVVISALVYGHGKPVNELRFGVLFVIGAVLARYEKEVRRVMAEAGRLSGLFLVCSLAMYWEVAMNPDGARHNLLGGIGSCGLLACSLNIPLVTSFLRHSAIEYLGRISFSLYMLHGSVIFATVYLLYGRAPMWAILGLGVATSFVFAHIFCVAVEEPAMRLGKVLTRTASS